MSNPTTRGPVALTGYHLPPAPSDRRDQYRRGSAHRRFGRRDDCIAGPRFACRATSSPKPSTEDGGTWVATDPITGGPSSSTSGSGRRTRPSCSTPAAVPTCEQAESYDAPVRGIEVPERTEDFTADPVELFFDLAYVLAFSQLVGLLVDDHTWAGVGRMALLFGLLWLPWQQLTWAANAVSGNGRAVRLIFLAATAASVPMAASTSTALDEGGPVFAATLAVIMALGFLTQTLGVERGTVLSRSVVRWQTPNVAALAVLVAGAVVDGGGRTVLLLLSPALVLAAMVAAGRGDWIVRSGHFAERHGLIVIIALGEVIVAIGLPVIQALEAGEGGPRRRGGAPAPPGGFGAP